MKLRNIINLMGSKENEFLELKFALTHEFARSGVLRFLPKFS